MASVPLERSRPRRRGARASDATRRRRFRIADAREVAAIMAAELDGLMRAGAQRSPGRAGGAGARGAARGAAAEADRASVSDQAGRRALRRDPARDRRRAGGGRAVQDRARAHAGPRAVAARPRAEPASAAGQHAEAVKAAKDFLAAWHLADKDRPELAEMRALAR